jgi:DNA-binding NarL/FixJ family response regulator
VGAIEAGAAGFVLKDCSAEDLIAAVRAVAGRGAWFDPGVAPALACEATVKTHVGSIFAKLGVRDRAAAIVFAYDHGVVTPGVTPL